MIRVAVLSRLRWAHAKALPAPRSEVESKSGDARNGAPLVKTAARRRWCTSLQCPMGRRPLSEFVNDFDQVVPLCRRCLSQRIHKGLPVRATVAAHDAESSALRDELDAIDEALRRSHGTVQLLSEPLVEASAAQLPEELSQAAPRMVVTGGDSSQIQGVFQNS